MLASNLAGAVFAAAATLHNM